MVRLFARILKPRMAGAFRVLVLLAVVQAVAVALWLRSAHARASEMLLSVGAELMKIEGADPNQAARSIFLNGITVHLRAASTDRELHPVLDGFHALCRSRTGVQAPQAVLDNLRRNAAKSASPVLDGVLRAESDSEGAIACVDTGMPLSIAELTSRLGDFARTGDLNAVGELRYVLARRVGGRTVVLTLWTEGSTPLLKMFPESGDAPGHDPLGVPRAPGTRRVLSAWENGQPYALALYEAAGRDTAVLSAFSVDALRSSGWSVESAPRPASHPQGAVLARRGTETVLVRVANDRRGQPTVSVAVFE